MADSVLAEFVAILIKVFRFLLERTIDLVCLAFLAAAHFAPWRWPFAIPSIWQEPADQTHNRGKCVVQFFISLFEAIALGVLLPICLCSGLRSVQVCRMVWEKRGKWNKDIRSNLDAIWAIYVAFGDLILDIGGLVLQLLSLLLLCATLVLGPWRAPCVCTRLGSKEVRADWKAFRHEEEPARHALFLSNENAIGVIFEEFAKWLYDVPHVLMGLVVCCTWRLPVLLYHLYRIHSPALPSVADIPPVRIPPEKRAEKRRELTREQLGQLCVDVLCVPFFILVFCSGWRTASLLEALTTAGKGSFDKQKAIMREFGELLCDVPFVFLGGLVLLNGWRANLLLRELCAPSSRDAHQSLAEKRREGTWRVFCALLKDGPIFLLLLLLTLTLYRLPGLLLQLLAATKRMLTSAPILELSEASVALDRKSKLRLVIRGRLTTADQHQPADGKWRVGIAVGGDTFWNALSDVLGATTASVAKSMLPLPVVPQKGLVAVDAGGGGLSMDITLGAAAPSTVSKKLRELQQKGDPAFTIQGVYGRREGVLFALHTTPSAMLAALASPTEAPASAEDPAALAPLPLDVGAPETNPHAQDGGKDARYGASGARGGAETPFQDVFVSVVLVEGLQLLLDIPHFLLALLVLLAPWRWLTLLQHLAESTKRWPLREALRHHRYLDDEQRHADERLTALETSLSLHVRGDENSFPLAADLSEPWAASPRGLPSALYHTDLEDDVKQLRKVDESLADAWSERLRLNQQHKALIVLEAEMQRMTIYPRHLAEAAWLLRLDAAKRNPAMRRRADTLIPGNTALRVNREEHSLGTALSLSHAALGMALDELEPHRAADAAARAACAATIEQRAAELRAATKGCKCSPAAICKRSMGKTRKMIVAHAVSGATDYLSLLALLVVVLSVYRLPSLARELRTCRCWASVQARTMGQVSEMALDAVLALETLLLTVTLYQALEHWLELSDAVLTKGNVQLARTQAHERIGRLFGDLCELLYIFPRVWDAYKLVLATLVFGTLVPIELVGRLLGRFVRCCGRTGHVVTPGASDGPRAVQVATTRQFQLGALVWGAFLAFPCVVVYYAAPRLSTGKFPHESGSGGEIAISGGEGALDNSPPEGLFALSALVGAYAGGILLLGLLSSCAALSSHVDRLVQIRFPRSRLRLTGANCVEVLAALLDAAQIIALPFLALQEATKWDAQLVAVWSGFFDYMADAASYVTLFLEMATASFEPLFWTAFGLVCFWYVLFSLPVVVGDLLRWERKQRVEESCLWLLLVTHLRVTLQLVVVMQLLKPLGCTYDPMLQPAGNLTAPPSPYSPPYSPPPSAPPSPFAPPACFNSSAANGTAPPTPLAVGDDDLGALQLGWSLCLAGAVIMALLTMFAPGGCCEDDDDDQNGCGIALGVLTTLACTVGCIVLNVRWNELRQDNADSGDAPLVDCLNFTFSPPPPALPPPSPLLPPELPTRYAHLRANPEIECWTAESSQPLMALCGLLALAFFLLTSHVISDDSHLLQLPQSSALDVRYSQLYVLVGHVFKIVLAVCFNLLLDVPEVLAPLLLSGTVLLLLWTLGYKWLLGETPCCQPLLTRIHAAGHAAAAWACLCCWLELRQTLEGGPALLGLRPSEAFCLLGWAVVAILFVLACLVRYVSDEAAQWRIRHTLAETGSALLKLERRLSSRGNTLLCEAWAKRRRRWRRAVSRPSDLLSLVEATVSLEQHLRASAQSREWLTQRAGWQSAVGRCVDADALRKLVGILDHAHDGNPDGRGEASRKAAGLEASLTAMGVPLPGGTLFGQQEIKDVHACISDIYAPEQEIKYVHVLRALVQLPTMAAATGQTRPPPDTLDLDKAKGYLVRELGLHDHSLRQVVLDAEAKLGLASKVFAGAKMEECVEACLDALGSRADRMALARGGIQSLDEPTVERSGPSSPPLSARALDTSPASAAASPASAVASPASAVASSASDPLWHRELNQVVVVVAAEVTALDASVPVVQAQLIEIAEVIGAAPPPSQPALEANTRDLQSLLSDLEGAHTNGERYEILEIALDGRRHAHVSTAMQRECLACGNLTCAAAALVARKFTLAHRQKRALVAMHPRIAAEEKAGFAAMLEQVLPSKWDRKEVLREVGLQ